MSSTVAALVLKPSPKTPTLPASPYPGFEPHRHPLLHRGREAQLGRALSLLSENRLLLCVHGGAGAGKTSFLRAALGPALRARGRPVVLVRRPDEPGIAARIVLQLADAPPGFELPDGDFESFAAALRALHEPGRAPVVLLDQLEDLFRRDPDGAARARIGALLAKIADEPFPNDTGFLCQWVLACREDWYPTAVAWLGDVLEQARTRDDSEPLRRLPRNLGRDGYFREMPLPPLGAEADGRDPLVAAEKVFFEAITGPLADAAGAPRYPHRFEGDAARRLARSFAETRQRRERDALVPELQLVLARLMSRATRANDGTRWMRLEGDPDDLVREVLRDHLRDKLIEAFEGASHETSQRRRTQAFFALSLLVDVESGQPCSVEAADLLAWLGEAGPGVLEKLTSEGIRLLVRDAGEADGKLRIRLCHEGLAPAIAAMRGDRGKEERKRHRLDEAMVALWEEVTERARRRAAGDIAATEMREDDYARVARGLSSIPMFPEVAAWWDDCQKARDRRLRAQGQRRRYLWIGGLSLLAAALYAGWWWYFRLLPEDYRARMEDHSPAAAAQAHGAYVEWSRLPMHAPTARAAFSRYLIERSLAAGLRGAVDEAILLRLEALEIVDSPEERAEIGYLTSLWPEGLVTLPHEGVVSQGALSPRGDQAATWIGNEVYLWSVNGPERHAKRLGHQGVRGARFSGDGTLLITWSLDSVRVWWTVSGHPMTPPIPQPPGSSPSPSPDGKLLFEAGSEGGTVRRLDATASEVQSLPERDWRWSPDSSLLAHAKAGRLTVWSAATGKSSAVESPGAAAALLFDATSSIVATIAGQQTRLWRIEEGVPSRQIAVLSGVPQWIDPNGDSVLVRNAGDILQRSAHTGALEAIFPSSCEAADDRILTFAAGELVGTCSRGGFFRRRGKEPPVRWRRLRTPETARLSALLDAEGRPVELVKLPSGTVALRRGDWNATAPGPTLPSGAKALATRDGRSLVAVWPVDNLAWWVRPSTPRPLEPVISATGPVVWPFQAPRDQSFKAQVLFKAQVWDTRSGQPTGRTFDVTPRSRSAVTVASSDGDLLAIGADGWLRLLNRGDGSKVCDEARADLDRSNGVFALSPDGRRLAFATGKEMELWDTTTCARAGAPLARKAPVRGLVFSAAGDGLLVLDRDGLSRLDADPGGLRAKSLRRLTRTPTSTLDRWTAVPLRDGSTVLQRTDAVDVLRGKELASSCSLATGSLLSWTVDEEGQWLATLDSTSVHLHALGACREQGTAMVIRGIDDVGDFDRGAVLLRFSPDGHVLAVAADGWIHFLEVGELGWRIRASRALPSKPLQLTFETAAPSEIRCRVVTSDEDQGVFVETISTRTDAPPVEGRPADLSRLWADRLGLQIGEDGGVHSITLGDPAPP